MAAKGVPREESTASTAQTENNGVPSTNLLARFDWAFSRRVFFACQRSSLWKTLATVVTLSGDEAVVYPFSAGIGFALLWHAVPGSPGELAARRLLRIYGDFGAVCLVEAGFKLIFQRPRPPWKAPATIICMLGERFR